MSLEVALLAYRPELVDAVADALLVEWPEWYGLSSREEILNEVRSRAQSDEIPLTLVALDADRLAGTVSLNPTSIPTHTHLSPWLGGLWVHAEGRRNGTGSALVAACRAHAERLGFERLYAATASAQGLFRRDGWVRFDTVELPAHPGETIEVFRFDLT